VFLLYPLFFREAVWAKFGPLRLDPPQLVATEKLW